MHEGNGKIIEALALLESARDSIDETPAMVVLPPDADQFIIGNRGGLVRLAIAALKAEQGEQQSFVRSDWVFEDDLDWGIKGLALDEHAHLYIPEKTSKVRQLLGKTTGYGFLIVIVIVFVAGIMSISHWLWHPKC